jgi:hypothetical protein
MLSASARELFAVGSVSLEGPFSGSAWPREVFVEGDVAVRCPDLGEDGEGGVEDNYNVSITLKFASPAYFLFVAGLRLFLCVATGAGACVSHQRRWRRTAPDQGSGLQELPEQAKCMHFFIFLMLFYFLRFLFSRSTALFSS